MEKSHRVIEELSKYVETISVASDVKEELTAKIEEIALQWNKNLSERDIYEKKWKECRNRCLFYEASIDALPNPVFIKDKEGKLVYLNLAYQEYFDMNRELYLDKTVLDLEFLPFSERERYQAEDLALIQSGSTVHYEREFEHSNGEMGQSLYWSSGFEVEGRGEKGLIGEIVDISLQKQLEKEIKYNVNQLKEANLRIEKMMNHDYLTGLYNRRGLEENVIYLDSVVEAEKSQISILMADLDDFKRVNDTFGHLRGDEILVQFSKILLRCKRMEDFAVRYGGEEFLIVLYDTEEDQAKMLAETIRKITERELVLPNGNTNTVSIGVAQVRPEEVFRTAIERADSALYEAKNQGKNKVV